MAKEDRGGGVENGAKIKVALETNGIKTINKKILEIEDLLEEIEIILVTNKTE